MTIVWDSGLYDGSTLLAALALADWSNDAGMCWPSVGSIARKTRQSERNVQYVIRRLIKDGAITREVRREKSSIYRINVGKFADAVRGKQSKVRGENFAPGENEDHDRVQNEVRQFAPKPSVEPIEPLKGGALAFPQPVQTGTSGKQGGTRLSQSERDTIDWNRLRKEMDRRAESSVGMGINRSAAEYAAFVRSCAFHSGLTPTRARELLKQFFPDDHSLDLIDPTLELGLTEAQQ